MTALSESGEFLIRLSSAERTHYTEYTADIIAVFKDRKLHHETLTDFSAESLWLQLEARGYVLAEKG